MIQTAECDDVKPGGVDPFGAFSREELEQMEELVVSAEICEDVWSPIPPSTLAAREGATVIVNCSASDETMPEKESLRQIWYLEDIILLQRMERHLHLAIVSQMK